jgi:glycosyltransferase involved in cell wall biosynthesis
LAAGTPSFVTNVGGLPEVVKDLAEDLIFPAGHPEGLANHLIAALRGEIAVPSADECRAYASERFDPSLAAMRTAKIYRELVF